MPQSFLKLTRVTPGQVLMSLVLAIVMSPAARSQYVANSLAELCSYASTLNGATISMTHSEYWMDGSHIANPTGSEPIFMELTGASNTFDLTEASFKVDTRDLDGLGHALGHDSTVFLFNFNGTNNTLTGLEVEGVHVDLDTDPNAWRHPNRER